MTYYSQHGEDLIIDKLINGQEIGFFVEIGCIDGRRFSNTLFLEERGWHGLCVEAHAGYIDALRKNRPNSIICHCAAGECDEETTFYANARGSLSTLDKGREKDFERHYAPYFSGFEEQDVKKVRVSTLLDENGINNVDVLSLDIEGYEVEALRGIHFSRHKPTLMIIESDTLWHEASLDSLLFPVGYLKVFRFGGNVFYFLGDRFKSDLFNGALRGAIIHTVHPLDTGNPVEYKIEIDLSLPFLSFMQRSILFIFRNIISLSTRFNS